MEMMAEDKLKLHFYDDAIAITECTDAGTGSGTEGVNQQQQQFPQFQVMQQMQMEQFQQASHSLLSISILHLDV